MSLFEISVVICLLALCVNIYFQMKHLHELENLLKFRDDFFREEFERSNDNQIRMLQEIEKLRGQLIEGFFQISRGFSDFRNLKDKEIPTEKKQRSEEQRKAASEKRKEWWEKKRQAKNSTSPDAS